MDILITIAIAAAGGLLAKKMKIPAGAMTGAMIFVVIFGLLTNRSSFPAEYKVYVQFFSGALIGVKLRKEDIIGLKTMVLPGVVQVLSMLALNLIFGLLMHYMGGLDIPTAFFSSAPAGMQDMALISADYGANPLYVSIIQMLRIVFIVSFMPTFYRMIIARTGRNTPQTQYQAAAVPETRQESALPKPVRLLLTIVVACAGGTLFRYLQIKSGALIGAIVATAILSIFTNLAYFPISIKTGTQICAGAYVGAQLKRETLSLLPGLIGPIMIMLVGMFVFVYVFGLIMQKVSHLDLLTSLLISTPGGMQEMSLMAQEFDCDTPKVVVMHVLRIMIVIFLFPTMIGMLEHVLP
ncbi:MAG: AbrB family transcriptional regulator [Solobacterium sp.]|nr:AbrB family transcriptional regulator [Solobacterium sp.]